MPAHESLANPSPGSFGDLKWVLTYQSDPGIVMVQTTGPVGMSSLPAMIGAVLAFAAEQQCLRFLVDHRQSELLLKPADIYETPKLLLAKRPKAALVFKEIGPDHRFLETVCANVGIQTFVFTDIDAALAWLTSVAK
jgi:hypothetical protein